MYMGGWARSCHFTGILDSFLIEKCSLTNGCKLPDLPLRFIYDLIEFHKPPINILIFRCFNVSMFQSFDIYDCYVGRMSSQWNNSTGICAQIRYFNSPVIIQNHTVHNCTLSHSTGILSKLSVKSSLTYQYEEEEKKSKCLPSYIQ